MISSESMVIPFVLLLCSCASVQNTSAIANAKQEQEIRRLIEQLVFAEGEVSDDPVIHPDMAENGEHYKERFKTCEKAFQKLYDFVTTQVVILSVAKDLMFVGRQMRFLATLEMTIFAYPGFSRHPPQ